SYVRTHSRELGLEDDYFQKHDIHVHVPAGAIPKDGPSAGVTMATAIASLVTGTPINSEVAMTGEVTLTGQVLPIGGLKEKTLAAQRAGITTVIMPSRNEGDLEDVPEELRKGMTFVPVDRVEQVWEAAMGLRLDGKGAELAEANDLLEEASELLQQARRKTGARGLEAAENRAGKAAAKTAPAKRAASRKAPLKKAVAKKAPVKTAVVRPKAPPPKAKGSAKKTTAARWRSGRKK
ncbi:MAG TPA: S16 family serine protease, partial [Thermoleophilia bacterium]